ncbi:hypothetical protein [uncultured Paludibaculum sp.]|uniref:hypothetical protein n=1 Tax=uncultured Paludibaculum sp. TaxID=1765020 RepID=UPI002AAB1A20|nr:hypothetical protein [uncultured Paludibaculum sp.]
MKVEQRLQRLFSVLLDAVKNDPALAERVEVALGIIEKQPSPPSERRNRRTAAALDPYAEFALGEESLVSKLRTLDIEALKDVVAQFGMDRSKLVMKWKTPDRIIDHIITTVRARAQQGDAFRS